VWKTTSKNHYRDEDGRGGTTWGRRTDAISFRARVFLTGDRKIKGEQLYKRLEEPSGWMWLEKRGREKNSL